MKANLKKAAGFFIVEILIVLVIIGILVAALLPNLTTYANRAKFVDVVNATGAVRNSVDGCIVQLGTLTNCNAGSYGIPNTPGSAGYFLSYGISNGIITSSSISGAPFNTSYTYILTPTLVGSGATLQATWAASGTCGAAGLC